MTFFFYSPENSLPDLVKYVGEWKEGKKHGQVTRTSADGDKYVGEFKKDRYWEGKLYDENGILIATYSMGIKKPVK